MQKSIRARTASLGLRRRTASPAHLLAGVATVVQAAAIAPVAAQTTGAALPPVTVSSPAAAPLERPAATGSRLDISPLETPASLDVVTREQLDARGDSSLMDAITRTTGVTSMAHPGNSSTALSARGFTDATSVQRLYDGVRQYGNVSPTFPFHTWAIERIEVLRGPASVLEGDSAIGAVVNVVPKKPTHGPVRNEVEATVGTDGKRGLAFGSGGAINDRLSYRLDASGERSNGWVDRGRNSNQGISGALRLDATPDLRITASHAQGWQKPINYYGIPLIDGQPVEALREKNYDVRDGRIAYRDRWSEVAAEWTPNDQARLRSRLYHIASNRYWHSVDTYNWNAGTGLIDRSGATEIAHRQRQTGNTTDLTLKHELGGLANQVALGFDVNRSSFRHTNNTYTGTVASVDPYDYEPGRYASPIPFIPRYRNTAQQTALFAEDRLVLSERWSVVAGLRRDRVELDRQDLVAGNQAFKRTFAHTGWRLGVVYQWNPTSNVYAQIARAADPVSSLLFLTPTNAVFDMSTGRQIEVGIKKLLPEQRGELTLAVYDIVKKNLLTRDATDPSLRVQVGQRSTRGIEATASLNLTPALRLDANAALLRGRYDDFSESVGGASISRNGNVPTDVPERVANLWLDWRVLPDWTVGAGGRYVGKRYSNNANTIALPAYTTVDLSVRWKATPDTTLALRGFNVLDRLYYSSYYYSASQWLVGEGRSVELSVHHRF